MGPALSRINKKKPLKRHTRVQRFGKTGGGSSGDPMLPCGTYMNPVPSSLTYSKLIEVHSLAWIPT